MRNWILLALVFWAQLLIGQTKIHIPEPFGDRFIESELISGVSIVPLAIERYRMITSDMEMKVDGDDYFILDNKVNQCVYRFNGTGELLNTICEEKKEAGEEDLPQLNNPAKFSIDPLRKQVEIYNFENSIITQYRYDGTKTGQLNLSVSPSDFIREKDGNYWIYTGWNNSETQYRLLKTDERGNITDRKMRLISKCTPTEGFAFYNTGNAICFWELLGNTAYKIEKNEITPSYLFNFGNRNLPLNYHIMEGDDSFMMINQSGYYTVKKYLENDDFAYFFLNYNSIEQREMFHVIHDKKAGQIYIYTENSAIGAFDKAQSLTADNELLFLITPRKIRQLLGGGTEFVPASFVGLEEQVGRMRNPVILKIKLQSVEGYQPVNTSNDSLYFDN